MEGFPEIVTFEKSAKYLPACGEIQASKIPTVKVELERNSEFIIKIPYNRELLGQMSSKTTEIYTHACLCLEHGRQVSNQGGGYKKPYRFLVYVANMSNI